MWFAHTFEGILSDLWLNNMPDRLSIQLYTTEKIDIDKTLENLHNSRNFPFFKNRLQIGRPNWNTVFRHFDALYSKRLTAIYCSGGKNLRREILNKCISRNKNGFKYCFVHEGFN